MADRSQQSDGFRVLVPALPWREGELGHGDRTVRFLQTERRGPLAELRVWAETADGVLEALAEAGFPVLGDGPRGGAGVPGGPRIRSASAPERSELPELPESPDWWPTEPVWPGGEGAAGAPPDLLVSKAAQRAIERGHPWLRPDPGCGDPSVFAPGTLVRLHTGRGRAMNPVGLAFVEGQGEVAARVWGRGARRPREVPSVEARVARALAARRSFLAPGAETDVYRLIHGEADGLPGWFVDRLGTRLRAVVTTRALEPLAERIHAALRSQLAGVLGPDPAIVEVLCLRPRPAGRLVAVRRVSGPAFDEPFLVRERGLRFQVETGLAEPLRPHPGFGLFPDMRENRALAARRAAAGGRWLNLFAHTGAFSAALLAGGADSVVSVDLSAPYLERLEANLERNGLLGPRHAAHRSDGRRYLERLARGERFAGIVLDPPTAAAAGRRFWSVPRDLEPMLELALSHLEPGGWLLVARNDRIGRGGARRLEQAVRRAALGASVALAQIADAPPGPDFPRLPHFPEGDPFRAVWVRRASP
ncbi:MAG: class I SAM-dependent rRNA methyltransferase [Myxococcota bacterium]